MFKRVGIAWLVLMAAVLVVTTPAAQPAAQRDEEYELMRLLIDTLDQVERNYVKPVSRRELVEAAIRGILSKLDPYSSYIGPSEMQSFRTAMDSQFGGIGIEIGMRRGRLMVLSPLVGTPAYRAGVSAGDWITRIDGQSTEGMGLDEAVKRLKGPVGSTVRITVVRPGQSREQELTITRQIIHIDTVTGNHRRADESWEFMLDPEKRIGYIRIAAFSRSTADELRRALDELQTEGMRALVLDLRFNPGGLLSSAVAVSDMFVSKGRIVSTEGRNVPSRSWEAHQKGTYGGFPMAVLVNRFTASGAEIVAACLQDHKRALVIGERTYGKGTVQNVIELEHDPDADTARTALKLTTAGYQRPSGHKIHRFPGEGEEAEWGVQPDEGFRRQLSQREMFAVLQQQRLRDMLPRRPTGQGKTERGEAGQDETAQEGKETGRSEGRTPPIGLRRPFVDPHLRMAVDYLSGQLAGTDKEAGADQDKPASAEEGEASGQK
ncbi:MAG TPA: S41 family peptidase [Planctomycetaceae bacterium]|nr:S41 family peptidase [Planctomycetaceae bacterium]